MQPDGLENKFRILSLLPFDRRIGHKHTAVLAFILDWHHRKYGDALASVRHVVAELKERDPFGRGFYTGDVHSALVDLVAWGYLTQVKGSGRRASRYVPVWSIFDSVRYSPNTTEGDASVRGVPNTRVRAAPNTTDGSVREAPNKDPSTQTRVQDPGTGIDGATLTAPCADALGGVAAGAGFEDLWRAYGYRKDKAKAREEFAKQNPQNIAELLAAAIAWREGWAAQGKGSAPRKSLHVWLKEERFDEEPPTAYAKKERKPSTMPVAAAPEPANDNSGLHRAPGRIRLGRYDALIVDSQVEQVDGKSIACLHIDIGSDAFTLHVAIESPDYYEQEAGQAMLKRLIRAVNLEGAEDSSELHNLPFELQVESGGALTFNTITAADAAGVTA
ncbi:hypothetical protein [Devosia riboflavina]